MNARYWLLVALFSTPIVMAAHSPSAPAAMQAAAVGVDPASLRKPLADSWPTYSGDYTGRRTAR